MTLALPQHDLQPLTDTITQLLWQRKTSVKKWRQLLGVLRSMTSALYGGFHLFSILQHALTTASNNRITLTQLVKTVLRDWLFLAMTATKSPILASGCYPLLHPILFSAALCVARPLPTHHSNPACYIIQPQWYSK
jgi:hypothetical protein